VIAHLVLRVADIERSRLFYGVLGLEFVAEKHAAGPRHYACEKSGTVLELYPRGDRVPAPIRFGLYVESVRLAETELGELHGHAIVGRDPDAQTLTISDPDGNTLDLIERAQNG